MHVHSKFSRRPSEWILKKIGCPESFTDPVQLYNIAKNKEMSRVTITDHNTIEGCLELSHLPDTFISEEVTTYFPDTGCKLHVLVYNIDEHIHEDIQKVRESVYDLTAYLNRKGITHALAHPLFSVNQKLTINYFEKCLLLFKNFELNGARSEDQNRCLQLILSTLTPEIMAKFEEKHDLTPSFGSPWIKNITAGSDDHSSLTIARRFTEVEGAACINDFMHGLEKNRASISGKGSTPKTLSHNIYSVAYQFYQHKFDLEKYVSGDVIFQFLDRFLRVDQNTRPTLLARLNFAWNRNKRHKSIDLGGASVLTALRKETNELIWNDPQIAEIFKNGKGGAAHLDERWFRFVNKASNKVLGQFTNHLMDSLAGAHFLNLFQSLGSAGALYSVHAPYFVAFSIFSEDRRFAESALSRFSLGAAQDSPASEDIKVAHFTDTFYEVNGVAGTLKRQLEAAAQFDKKYEVITCDAGADAHYAGVQNFNPIGVYELSVYPEQKLFYPPFLEMLNYCYEKSFTHIHSATPGPLGLAALAIARILRIPLVGTYHTALPQYAQYFTEDASITELTWKYVLWYYDQMDVVYVPSKSTAAELVRKGLSSDKIRVFSRGVDTVRFNPNKRNDSLKEHFHSKISIKLLYVGRVSREKNLQLLANVFKFLNHTRSNVGLVVVGDGPYLDEMRDRLKDTPSLFTGYLEGEALEEVYASCDLFVFPSSTDTFGNVVMEAQASGVPVIVTDCGGPQENLLPTRTGLIVEANSERSLLEGIESILSDLKRLKEMGIEARQYAESRSFDKAFIETWELYREVPAPSSSDFVPKEPWSPDVIKSMASGIL